MLTFFGWTLILSVSALIGAVALYGIHIIFLYGWQDLKEAEERVRLIRAESEAELMQLEESLRED